ncbi:hypothetical protein H4582DRAFT_1977128 [Lactarius indigo]|nr:hypothetical protein H4582DRAFT_1977128 [Lactarius indigo]
MIGYGSSFNCVCLALSLRAMRLLSLEHLNSTSQSRSTAHPKVDTNRDSEPHNPTISHEWQSIHSVAAQVRANCNVIEGHSAIVVRPGVEEAEGWVVIKQRDCANDDLVSSHLSGHG